MSGTGAGGYNEQQYGTLSGQRLQGKRSDKLMRKAEALGMETRNVPNGYLAPIAARRGIASPRDAFLQGPQARGGYNPSVFHENLTPKVITQYKTAKMLQQIGQKAVLSNNPYVDTAMETLIQKGPGAEQSEEMPMRRPMGGKLPRKGAKAAAMKRAKRLVGAGAAFSPEVPLEDALRAANIETDRAALHALLKAYIFTRPKIPPAKLESYADALSRCKPAVALAAAAMLMQAGFFFTALKAVYNEFDALSALLDEMELLVAQHLASEDWATAAATWAWKDPDREVFLNQFSDLRIITYYMDVRKQLRALKEQGVVALARVEREMLLKVTRDFKVQLQEEYASHKRALEREAEERGRARAKVEAQAAAAAAAANKRAAEAARADAKSRAVQEAKGRKEAEARAKASEAERKREEVRARAEEIKRAKAARAALGLARKAPEYALVQGDAVALFKEALGAGDAAAQPEADMATMEAQLVAAEAEAAAAEAEAAAAYSEAASGPHAPPGSAPASPRTALGRTSSLGGATATGGDGAGPLTGGRSNASWASMGSMRMSAAAEGSGQVLGALEGQQQQQHCGESESGGEERGAGLQEGIEELKRTMSESRKKADDMAAQLRNISINGSGTHGASPRAHTPVRLSINLAGPEIARINAEAAERLHVLEEALEAERAAFALRLEEERMALAQVLAEERSRLEGHLADQKAAFDEERARLLQELYEQQGLDIDAQLAASAHSVRALQEQRDALRSSSGGRAAAGSGRSARSVAAKEESSRLEAAIKMLEKKLDDEVAHAKMLSEEKTRLESEREALESMRNTLEVQKSQAELEKTKMEQEKGALQEQIAKTMRMFQEQLAQTVKMAAMLQAQRILGAASGGPGSMAAGPPLPAPVMPLPHEMDEPPTREEILEYAKYLGMDPGEDGELLYIAEWALTAPLPEGWTVHLDGDGNEFFYHAANSASTYEHPMDEHYRQYYTKMKEQKQLTRMAALQHQ